MKKIKNGDALRRLTESAVLIAIATVLSVLKLLQLPFGGSVTPASALPILLIAYRYGTAWGVGSAVVYGIIQQLLGLGNLSYVAGWVSVVAVILLDYIAAFASFGLGGVFRGKMATERAELTAGALLISALRFLCHFIAGAFVWAECFVALPTWSGIVYSLGYTATYMLPETVVLVAVTRYLGSELDFRLPSPRRLSDVKKSRHPFRRTLAGLLIAAGAIADALIVFPHLQSEAGFSFAGFAEVDFVALAIVSALLFGGGILLRLSDKKKRKNR